jgi:positive regulator of sigma E activity
MKSTGPSLLRVFVIVALWLQPYSIVVVPLLHLSAVNLGFLAYLVEVLALLVPWLIEDRYLRNTSVSRPARIFLAAVTVVATYMSLIAWSRVIA